MNEDNTALEFMHAQSDIIEKVNESMPDEEILYDLAELDVYKRQIYVCLEA